jgi:hypothetical protein
VSDGRVLAAEFVNAGKRHRAVWFESTDGQVRGYFSPDGHGMRKAFLRAPVDFTRISSRFNPQRLHPISGRIRAHKGIDYAAPTGTPIRAAGQWQGRVCRPQGRLRQLCRAEPWQRHHDAVRPHVADLAGSPAWRSREPGRSHRLCWHDGRVDRSTPALRVPRARCHKNPATVTMPRTELPTQYRAEFQQQAGVALARLAVVARPLNDSSAYASN